MLWRIPVGHIPAAGTLRLTADIFIESTTGPCVAIGNDYNMISTPWGGMINDAGLTAVPVGQWFTQSIDLVVGAQRTATRILGVHAGGATAADVGMTINNIVLSFYVPTPGRIVVYVDNIRLEGTTPDWSAYNSASIASWAAYKTRIQSDVASRVSVINSYSGGTAGTDDVAYVTNAQSRAAAIQATVTANGYPNGADYNELLGYCAALPYLALKVAYINAHPANTMILYAWQPTTGNKALPFSNPLPAAPGTSVALKACPGEFEPVSFVIQARSALSNITLETTDLTGPGGASISQSALDVRLVKVWYQDSSYSINQTGKAMVPELLIKDDDLVHVDLSGQTNQLRIKVSGVDEYVDITSSTSTMPSSYEVHDATTLQPFSLAQFENKQIWVTAHIPDNAVPGEYTGQIAVKVSGVQVAVINISLIVLPFTLPKPDLDYGLYYRGYVTSYTPAPYPNSEEKTLAQYTIEMQDMFDHGVLYPNFIQGSGDSDDALTVRRNIGFPTDQLYVMNTAVDFFRTGSTPEKLAALQTDLTNFRAVATAHGYDQVYIYSIDEAVATEYINEQPAFQLIHDNGMKIFGAIGWIDPLSLGDSIILQDIAIWSGGFNVPYIQAWHDKGKKCFSYGNPQVGVEDPSIYRRNYGFALWNAGYDGEMDYAYQHGFGSIWNDFDDAGANYRDHVFAYPTSDGVIDTVEWEGFRAAVDDVRYLSLLKKKVSDVSTLKAMVSDFLSTGEEMAALRGRIIDKLLAVIRNYGDVNGDGQVNAYDAALTARYSVGYTDADFKNASAADVDNIPGISAYDAALIAQRAVGLISKYPVEN